MPSDPEPSSATAEDGPDLLPRSDEAILDAALAAFAEQGFAGTSVRDLARKLGVSHNYLPQRFGTKERLWYAAVDHGFASLAQDLLPAPSGDDDVEVLRATIVRFIEAIGSRPSLLRVVNQEATCPGPRLDHLYERYIGPTSVATEEALACLWREHRARPVPTAAFYFLLTHGAVGPLAMAPLAQRFGPVVSVDDPSALRSYAEAIADIIIHGVALPGTAAGNGMNHP